MFSAVQAGVEFPILFVIPSDREGVVYNNDWNNMGQRRTASGSFTFDNVLVTQDEILGPPPTSQGAFAGLLYLAVQLTKVHVYLGIAEGAFAAAFDRYWRHLRTFTLHDPVDYKLYDIGNWVLNQELPLVSQYS